MSKEPSPFVLHKRISIHTTSRCTAYKIYPKSMAPNPNDFTYLTKRANWIVVSSTLRQWAGRKKERERESWIEFVLNVVSVYGFQKPWLSSDLKIVGFG